MISRFFKKRKNIAHKKEEIKVGDFFVVQSGTYGGDYLLLMEKNKDDFHFFVLPDKTKRVIKEADFLRGRENNIVAFIESVPVAILKDCKTEYSRLNK